MHDAPYRVVWSEGMLVAPQHLQQQALYHDAMLDARLAALHRHAWGIIQLSVDVEALRQGHMALPAGRLILPSGTWVSWDGTRGDSMPQRALGERLRGQAAPLDVYVGVPREREGVVNVAAEASAVTSERFAPVSRTVAELTAAATPALQMQFARPRPRIYFADETHDDIELLKIAELQQGRDGLPELNPSFWPTCLSMRACGKFSAEVAALVHRLDQTCRSLEQRFALRLRSDRAMLPAECCDFMRLGTLRAAHATMIDVMDDGDATPHEAYRQLRRAAGLLAAACSPEDGSAPATLPPFDPADLRGCLGGLLRSIHSQVPADATVAYSIRNFVEAAAGAVCDVGDLLDSDRGGGWYLLVEGGPSLEALVAWWPRLSKLAAPQQLAQWVRAAAAGLPQTHVVHPPSVVPWPADAACFALDTDSPIWRAIVQARSLALMAPATIQDVAVHARLVWCQEPARRA